MTAASRAVRSLMLKNGNSSHAVTSVGRRMRRASIGMECLSFFSYVIMLVQMCDSIVW